MASSAIALFAALNTNIAAAQDAHAATGAPMSNSVTNYRIAAGTLADALHQFSEQSGLQVFFESELVRDKSAPALSGELPAPEALARLLHGSGLEWQYVNDRTLVLRRPNADTGADAGTASAAVVAQAGVDPVIADGPGAVEPAVPVDSATESVTTQKRGGIEEVIVTARKREESIQDVPISITALTAEDMKIMGIRNVGDMEGIVPGLNMSGGGNGLKKDSNPFIRGVGQRETKVTLDPGVATYIDGIYLARTGGALLDTVGMERVEVLRGPQGTLFGRNAVGGSISFTTIKPKPEFSGSISATVGNYGRSDVVAVANIPILGDELLSRFTISSKSSDGFYTNVLDGERWGDDNRITGIGQVRWLPANDLTIDLLAERTRIRETPRPSKCILVRPFDRVGSATPYLSDGRPRPNYNPYFFFPLPVSRTDQARNGLKTFQELCSEAQALPDDRFISDFAQLPDVDGNDLLDKGRYWIDTATAGLTATWDIGSPGMLENTQLKSITAWRKVKQIADEDLDAVGMGQLLRVQDGFNESWQGSQEIQLTGAAMDGRLFFSSGLFYLQEKTPQDVLVRAAGIGMDPIPSTGAFAGSYLMRALEPTQETLETDNNAYAWFGQVDFNLTQQLQLALGIRYTYEKRWSAYTKAYALSPSMIAGDIIRNPDGTVPSGAAGDGAQTQIRAAEFGLNKVLDWEFYSAEYLGIDPSDPNFLPNCPLAQWEVCRFTNMPPGYLGLTWPSGVMWGREFASTDDEAWTPMASIKYHAGSALLDRLRLNDAMAYLTYSEGFGAGGVTAGAVDSNSFGGARVEDPVIFRPQHVKNYEVGLKMQAWDRRVQSNIAMFYTDYRDMQITSAVSRAGIPIPFIDNVGKSVIQGVESEFIILPLRDWRLILNAAYTDADMKVWAARNLALNPLTGIPVSEAYSYLDRSDEPMPRVPEWQLYLLADYTLRLSGGSVLVPSVAARYTSEIYHGFDRGSYCFTIGYCNISQQIENPVIGTPRVENAKDSVVSEEVVFLDARLSWISGDGKMEIAAWGKNLTNKKDYLVGAIPLVDVTGTVAQVFADPRTFGLTMTYNFGLQ